MHGYTGWSLSALDAKVNSIATGRLRVITITTVWCVWHRCIFYFKLGQQILAYISICSRSQRLAHLNIYHLLHYSLTNCSDLLYKNKITGAEVRMHTIGLQQKLDFKIYTCYQLVMLKQKELLSANLCGCSTDSFKLFHVWFQIQLKNFSKRGTRIWCQVETSNSWHFLPMTSTHTPVTHDTNNWNMCLKLTIKQAGLRKTTTKEWSHIPQL